MRVIRLIEQDTGWGFKQNRADHGMTRIIVNLTQVHDHQSHLVVQMRHVIARLIDASNLCPAFVGELNSLRKSASVCIMSALPVMAPSTSTLSSRRPLSLSIASRISLKFAAEE